MTQVSRLLYAVLSTICRPLSGAARFRRPLGVLTAIAMVAVAACEDPFEPRATSAVRTATFTVFAMSGTPVNVPTAFNLVFFTPVRMEPAYGFHLAFDIDTAGRVMVVPVTRVGGVVAGGRRIGIQRSAVPFDQLQRAPGTGYHYDSTFVVNTGEPLVVEAAAEQCPINISTQLVYAKLEVGGIDPVNRRLTFRVTYDPNCGFRSFLPGIPTN